MLRILVKDGEGNVGVGQSCDAALLGGGDQTADGVFMVAVGDLGIGDGCLSQQSGCFKLGRRCGCRVEGRLVSNRL